MKPLRRSTCKHFVLYTGPTNSGKTFHALEELKTAPSGAYAAPLRLLAYEGFRKLNDSGVPTSLLTGQQRIATPDAKHVACTVEMLPNDRRDVAVLDEIQLIGDPSRGFAWTKCVTLLPCRALLQAQSGKMILCGQSNAVPLVKRLVEDRDVVVEEKEFGRFNELRIQDRVVEEVRRGDCIVCFSRRELYRIKQELEAQGQPVNIVYGALPPEARIIQADEFNKGESVLVATDAVGLGLNLQIKRVVFSTVWKFDGQENRRLTPCEVKQIAGRSGRGMDGEHGYVTALEEEDRAYIASCFNQAVPEVAKAGFLPSMEDLVFMEGGDVPANMALSKLLERYLEQHYELPELRDFFLCELDDIIDASMVCDDEAPKLDLSARFTYAISPVDLEDQVIARYFALYIRQHAESGIVRLKVKVHEDDMMGKQMPLTEEERSAVSGRIARLESLYSVIDCYIWLAIRFGERIYCDMELAIETRRLCAEQIDRSISRLGMMPRTSSRRNRDKKRPRGSRRRRD